jgi:hypothetical protein
MKPFKKHELKVLDLLASSALPKGLLERIKTESELVSFESNKSAGYFLKVSHSQLTEPEVTCNEPLVIGQWNEFICGFIVFIGKGTLTIECHEWDKPLPDDFREQDIRVGIGEIESSGSFKKLNH